VNRSKVIGAALTSEEYEKLLIKISERERELGKRLSVSNFLRELILPIINGQNPIQSPSDVPESVSKSPPDTAKSKPLSFDFDS
jgi:hypothetical protein